jgi:dTDP-4-amino-4,6-dideoxygalactose transaminase
MDAITALASEHGIAVIEDCAQAHGATWNGRPVGSFGHINAFSFCQDKIITTGGEGGLLATNDERLWSSAWSFKDHGKSFDAVYKRDHPPGFRWLHENFGTNARLTEVQAAIGRIQLRKLPEWSRRRRANSDFLAGKFAVLPALRVPQPDARVGHACYKFYCYVRPEKLAHGWTRDRVMTAISALGVPAFSGSCSEIYLEKSFNASGLAPRTRLPIARELGETSLMFLVHPTVEQRDLDDLVNAVRIVLEEATR